MFNAVFFGGIVLVLTRVAFGFSVVALIIILSTLFLLGTIKAFVRWRAVSIPLAQYRKELRRSVLAHTLLWPLGASLFLYNAIVAGFSRRILWRGISYELKSPTEAVIISRHDAS